MAVGVVRVRVRGGPGWFRTAAALLVTALALASCGGAAKQRVLRIVMDNDIRTLDPHHHNTVTTWSLLSNVYDGLVRFSRDMQLEPALATSWRLLDATHVRFELRRDAIFHDGHRLTAEDVVASFERARSDPRSAIRHQLVGIRAVTAEGDRAVVVETERPSPTLLNRLAFLFIVPADQARLEEIAAPIGTGPYRFLRRNADGSVDLEAFGGWRGRPPIRRITFAFDPDDPRRIRDFLDGRTDIVHRVPDEFLPDVRRNGDLRLEVEPRMAVQLLRIMPMAASGPARAALADLRVRRAMLLAIDRRDLVDRVFAGNATVASQFVHPVVFGYDPSITPQPHDPVEAKRLMAEAGFGGGFATVFTVGAGATEIAAPISAALARIGIRAEIRTLPFPELVERASHGEIPLVLLSRTCTTGDASELLDSVVHTADPARGYGAENWGSYSNPAVDELLERADRELDPAARLGLLQQAQRQALADLPMLPLTVRWGYVGLSPRVDIVTRHDEWLWAAAFRWRR